MYSYRDGNWILVGDFVVYDEIVFRCNHQKNKRPLNVDRDTVLNKKWFENARRRNKPEPESDSDRQRFMRGEIYDEIVFKCNHPKFSISWNPSLFDEVGGCSFDGDWGTESPIPNMLCETIPLDQEWIRHARLHGSKWWMNTPKSDPDSDGQRFMDRYVRGEIPADSIDGYVRSWHESVSENGELHSYLGMTWYEYVLWVENPMMLAFIASDRKNLPGRVRLLNEAEMNRRKGV